MIIRTWRAAVLLVLTAAAPAFAEQFEVRWIRQPPNSNRVIVEVAGLSPETVSRLRRANWKAEQWEKLLGVYAEQGDVAADLFVPPMLGSYGTGETSIRFTPQFALEPGVNYRAVFRTSNLPGRPIADKPIASVFKVPARQAESTTAVIHIYPSADGLPENLLKFYVHFSAPMSRGNIYEHIHLRDKSGKEVDLPFLQIDEELWDSTMTRLTLFIDPGRIKRGVLPLEEIGPALESGKEYILRIDRAWRDARGAPLKEDFEKRFRVIEPDRQSPDQTQWKVHPPKTATRDALTIDFSEPMDHALASRMIRVRPAFGPPLNGTAGLSRGERKWSFTPAESWKSGPYEITVQTTIEDLAGNNIGKTFEVDLFEGVQRRFTNSVVKISFEVR